MYIKSIATLKTLDIKHRKESFFLTYFEAFYCFSYVLAYLPKRLQCSGSMRASLLFVAIRAKITVVSGVAMEKKSRHIGQICMISILIFANVLSKLKIIHVHIVQFSVTSVTAIVKVSQSLELCICYKKCQFFFINGKIA